MQPLGEPGSQRSQLGTLGGLASATRPVPPRASMYLPPWPLWAQRQASPEYGSAARGASLRGSCGEKQELWVASKWAGTDFPGGPVVRTQCFHCRDPRFNRETKILHTGQAAKSKNKEILYDSTERKFKNRKINVTAEKWFLVGDGGRLTGKECKRNF